MSAIGQGFKQKQQVFILKDRPLNGKTVCNLLGDAVSVKLAAALFDRQTKFGLERLIVMIRISIHRYILQRQLLIMFLISSAVIPSFPSVRISNKPKLL